MVKDKVGRPPGELGVRERERVRERESLLVQQLKTPKLRVR